MTSNPPKSARRGSYSFLLSFMVGALLLVLIGCAALALTPTLVGALQPSPTSAERLSFALVEIAKPTSTPTLVPTIAPTAVVAVATQAPSPTPAPSSQLSMNYVTDSSVPTSAAVDSGQVNSAGKYIDVSISQQHLWAYDNGQPIYSFVASTGSGNSTRVGTFSVLDKIPNAYGATWNIWMPNWLGIYWAGTLEDGIHALPILPNGNRLWSGYLGTPISYGCVVLGVDESLQLYNWADIGTPVVIRW